MLDTCKIFAEQIQLGSSLQPPSCIGQNWSSVHSQSQKPHNNDHHNLRAALTQSTHCFGQPSWLAGPPSGAAAETACPDSVDRACRERISPEGRPLFLTKRLAAFHPSFWDWSLASSCRSTSSRRPACRPSLLCETTAIRAAPWKSGLATLASTGGPWQFGWSALKS